jgi:hypothetical protein
MGDSQMNKLIAFFLSTCAFVGVVLAGAPEPTRDRVVVAAIEHVAQDMGDAMVRADIDALNRIL